MDYTVEFPSDEEEGNQKTHCRLAMEDENILAIEVAQSLNLKRSREAFEEHQQGEIVEQGPKLATVRKSRKQGINDWVGQGIFLAQQNELLLKAEEAGQTMPPSSNDLP